ncbi:MAG: ABC-2 transporter permease [Pseudobutyrivibrio sp.]|nr:ABC-2 transporter permease [Pseudobutyrivibrio sp.]
MSNLIKMDYIITKKFIIMSLVYSMIFPVIMILDIYRRDMLVDFFVPLVFVTAPLACIMSKEDTKSVLILQKMLPFSTKEFVGARYLFTLSLVVMSETILAIMKVVVYGHKDFREVVVGLLPTMMMFMICFAVYLAAYYWKGFSAAQIFYYSMVIVMIFGRYVLARFFTDLLDNTVSKAVFLILLVGIVAASFILSCHFEDNKKVDMK